MIKKQTKCKEDFIKILCVIGAVLIFIDVVGEFITFMNLGAWPMLFGTIFYTVLGLLLLFMCMKPNKPTFTGSVILAVGVIIIVLGIIRLITCPHIVLYNYIWWIVILTIIAGIIVILTGIMKLIKK
jgi:hypothetical protein